MATLEAGNYTSYPNLRLSGYSKLGDGGEGDLVLDSSLTGPSDSCTFFVDAAGNHFRRIIKGNPVNEISFYECGAVGDGMADDTSAIQNAISAALVSASGSSYARIFCPKGVFKTDGNTIAPIATSGPPKYRRIELVGEHVAGVAGCEIIASGPAVTILSVTVDTFKMEDVWLFGAATVYNESGNCLVLGSTSLELNDTTISNSWIANCGNAGINIVNAQGLFINNTTFEQSFGYGILANPTGTTNYAQNITINGSTFFGNTTAISIQGSSNGITSTASIWNITGGTSFGQNGSSTTCSVSIQNANAIAISGNRFIDSRNHDICGTGVSNLTVADNLWFNGGGAAVDCYSQCIGAVVANNNGGNMWLGYAVGFANSAIFVFSSSSANDIVMGNSFYCTGAHAVYGLYTDSTVTNTGAGPNLFSCETTAAYDLLGSKAWSY